MKKIRNIMLFISIFALSLICTYTTIAYLITETSPVIGTFIPEIIPTGDIIINNQISHNLGDDYVIPDNIKFTYEIDLGEEYFNTEVFTSQGMIKTDATGKLTITEVANEDIIIFDINENTEVTITSKTSLPGFSLTNNTQEIIVKPDLSATLGFTHTYNPTPVKTDNFSLTGTKTLNREWTNQDTFTFVLERKINNEYQTKNILQEKKRKKDNQLKKIEKDITDLEEVINSLTEQLHSEEVLNDYKKYNDITKELNEIEEKLEKKMEEWELLQ